jgi:hypothetical protein
MKPKQSRIVVCEKCGKEFEAQGKRKYCSTACAELMNKLKQAQAHRAKREQERASAPPRYCKRCGIELPVDSYTHRKYCVECSLIVGREYTREYNARIAEERRQNSKPYTRKTHTFRCAMCGREAETNSNNVKYCESCRKRKRRDVNVRNTGKREGREVYQKVCERCGLPFDTLFEDHVRCTDCIKGRTDTLIPEEVKPTPLSLTEQMREIEAYNREHGTNLSYGKYMAMMGR